MTPRSVRDLALIGSLVKDAVDGAPPRPGGAVYYQCRALAALGATAEAHAVTRCAEDDRLALLEPLERFGVPVIWRAARETQAFSFHYEGDRRIMEIAALGDPWTPEDIESWAGDALGDAGWILVGALTRADFPPQTLAALRAGGRELIVDAQGLVRRGQLGPLVLDAGLDRACLNGVRVLKLNDVEAQALVGSEEPEALRRIGVPEVVLTLGSKGAVVVTARVIEHVPAEPLARDVDPTGAGDTFLIGYVHARRRGAEPVEALRAAGAITARVLAGELRA